VRSPCGSFIADSLPVSAGLGKNRSAHALQQCTVRECTQLLVAMARLGLRAKRTRHIIMPVLRNLLDAGRHAVPVRDVADTVCLHKYLDVPIVKYKDTQVHRRR
jgi:hypothetical protein